MRRIVLESSSSGNTEGRMRRVIVESPYAGNIDLNLRYLRACMRDCLLRGESPYAGHGLYTQPGVLRDEVPEERKLGIDAGFEWREVADATVFYTDLGWSKGMLYGESDCLDKGLTYEIRTLPADVMAEVMCES